MQLFAFNAQAMTLTIPSAEEQLELKKWCKDELVSLPWSDLPASDGSIAPLSQPELQKLAEHIDSGHVQQKNNLCRGCLKIEGPRRIHRTIRDIDKATHTLHIDIAGPLIVSDDGFAYFLVGALRMPAFLYLSTFVLSPAGPAQKYAMSWRRWLLFWGFKIRTFSNKGNM